VVLMFDGWSLKTAKGQQSESCWSQHLKINFWIECSNKMMFQMPKDSGKKSHLVRPWLSHHYRPFQIKFCLSTLST
jgi:hypothetical protein